MPRIALNSRRSRTSCSILALATVMAVGSTPAHAQSLLGTGNYVTNANVTGITTTSGVNATTTINLNGGNTIIEWTPTNLGGTGNIVFQNAGTTATFTGSQDFAVLNRVMAPTGRAIEMNGTINSRVSGVQRGSVYFYAPGGFVFGGTSVFSVGSLVLSALNIDNSDFMANAGGNLHFLQATDSNAAIQMNGTVSASNIGLGFIPPGSSYVALVAPRVSHSGSITVNGSAALVAAEEATINFSPDGLFDISVTAGADPRNSSSDPLVPLSVSGDITGPTPTGVTDKQNIYLVAVPKNDALTMVISNGADLGFTLANTAVDDNGTIVLSAGHDIVDGQIGNVSAGLGDGAGADIWFTGAHATNNLFAEATGYADFYSTDAQASQMTTTFNNDVTIHADEHVLMNADGVGSTLTVGGVVSLSSDSSASTSGGPATGGDTELSAWNGGVVTLNSDVYLTAGGIGADGASFGTAGGSGTGGSVTVDASGDISIAGDLFVSANGLGGSGSGANGGSGTGGTIDISATGYTLDIGGRLDAYARGVGGEGAFQQFSGPGQGGTIDIKAFANGDVSIADGLLADATGQGGFVGFRTNGANGTGGTIHLQADGTNASLDTGDNVVLLANGQASDDGECIDCGGGIGGNGQGGTILASANNGGTLTLPGTLSMSAEGWGGVGVDANAGWGHGGFVQLFAGENSVVNLTGALLASADGYGGERIDGGYGGDLDAFAGDGTGGLVEVFTFGSVGSTPDVNLLSTMDIHADGYGGGNSVSGVTAFGGNGTGGQAWLDAQVGTINVTGSAIVTATGHGGDAAFGTGGTGTGRNAEIDGIGGTVTVGGTALVDASGIGGDGLVGGDGVGGGVIFEDSTFIDGAHIFARNGSVSITGAATVGAQGVGGDGIDGASGASGGDGGDGSGGFASILAANSDLGPSNISLSTLNISASATGGAGGSGGSGNQGGNGGDGGDAVAGQANVIAYSGNGHLTVGTANVLTTATGGAGGDGGNGDNLAGGDGGTGGNATGGFSEIGTASGLQAASNNLGTASYGTILADSSATGGDGGAGSFGTPDGNGGAGGTGDGGRSTLLVRGSQVTVSGTTTLTSNGTGGDGGTGGGELGTQGIGGDGFAGEISITATSRFQHPEQTGTLTTGAIIGSAIGTGGDGSVDGSGIVEGGSSIFVDKSKVHIASLNFTITGDEVADGSDASQIVFGNVPPGVEETIGTALVDGTFSFSTIGELSFVIDNANLDVGTLNLAAGNFVADELNSPAANRGTAFADSATITTEGDFIADADFDIGSGLEILAPGLISAHDFTVDGDLELTASGGGITVGNIDAAGSASLVAIGNILAGDITAGEHIGLATPGTMTTGDIDAGGVFMALGHGDMIFGDATADEVFLADYQTLVLGATITGECFGTCGSLGPNGVVTSPPSGTTYSFVTTDGGDPGQGQLPGEEGTNGTLYTTTEFSAAAGDDLNFYFNYVTSDGSSFADYAWAALFTPSLDPVAVLFTARTLPSGTIVPGQDLPGVEATLTPSSVPIIDGAPTWSPLGADSGDCFAAGCGYTGWISSSYEIAQAGDYILRIGVTNFSDTSYNSGLAFSGLTIGGVAVGPTLTPTGGSITIGDVNTGKFSAAAGTSLTTGLINSTGSIDLGANGAISTGNLTAGDFVLGNGGSITTGSIDADSVDMTSTAGNITATGDINVFGDVVLNAFGDITTQDITAGSIDLVAGDDITTGDLTTEQQIVLLSLTDGPITTLSFPGASISLESGGDISTGNLDSIDGVWADAGGSLTTLNIDANDFVELHAVNNIQTGYIDAGSYIFAESTGGGIDTGNLTGSDIELDAAGTIAFDDVDGYDFDFSAGGNVNGGNIVVDQIATGEAGGSVTLGNITAGPIVPFDDFSVGISAIGNINVGNVSGAGHVGFATQGNLTTGNLTAGDLVMTLVGGNTTVNGSISNTGEFGEVYMADDSMFLTGGGTLDGEGDFDPSIVLALDPVPTGGAITINGPVTTGRFRAATGTTLTTQAITADDIFAYAGGLAVINGAWNAGDAELVSNDIDITSNGSITAGDISLVSKNATRTIVGDGTNLTGYTLSDAEYGRLSSNDITVGADTAEGAAAIMVIGNLNVDASGLPDGADYEFVTGNGDTETASGIIRVVGNATFTGMTTPDHMVSFATGRFELEAATGSLSLFSTGQTLGGVLYIDANQVHVASTSLLNQLAANPTFTNYQFELDKPATVQRPEGVLRADTIYIDAEGLQDVLIQNTGSAQTRAGFVARNVEIPVEEAGSPAGSVNISVNGQVVTEGGTLTGVEARDALVSPDDAGLPAFTANSTINGCALTGPCVIKAPPPPPTANVVDNQIDLITGDPLGDSDFGNEDSIDDNEDGNDAANNPISPPQPLFDTRPLIPSSEINDPVSGTGNPALLGSESTSDDTCEKDEKGQCTTPKGDGQ